MIQKIPLLLLLTILSTLSIRGYAETLLRISFSDSLPSESRTYGTRPEAAIQDLTVISGHSVTFMQQQGIRENVSGIGWLSIQIERVPENAKSVSVRPTLENDRIILEIDWDEKQYDQTSSFSTTVSGLPGEWIEIIGASRPATPTKRTYGSKSASKNTSHQNGLYVKVEKVS